MDLISKEFNGLTFILDETNLTAQVGYSPNANGDIFIPHSIIYNFKEFVITSIKEGSFENNGKISSIQFSEDSEVRSFEKGSFSNSTIKSLTIPPKLEDFQKGWCDHTSNLYQIIISPHNKNFFYLDNEKQMIVGKSNKDSQFDVLHFACRNIAKVTIPSSIKHICSYSFSDCKNLKIINFEENSELISIDEFAFSVTSIECFTIPSKVKEIKEGWAHCTWCLNRIEISSENKNFCYVDKDRKIIARKSNEKSDIYDEILFGCRDIRNAFIPSYIKRICYGSFHACHNLRVVAFSEDSELISIGKYAFSNSAINNISIPKSVKCIESFAFYSCYNLHNIELFDDSELTLFDEYTFAHSTLNRIFIPRKLTRIGSGCLFAPNLKSISLSPNNENFSFLDEDKKIVVSKSHKSIDNYDVIVFACRDIEKVVIPSFIKIISPFAFAQCKKLTKVEFSDNSELTSISESCFVQTAIDYILIPKNIIHINSKAFNLCMRLKKIEFEKDSKLKSIGKLAFESSSLEEIVIPKSVNEINCYSFSGCSNLKKFSIEDGSNLNSISESSFSFSALKRIVIPKDVETIKKKSFYACNELVTVEIVGFNLLFESLSFEKCQHLFIASLPNAMNIICYDSSFSCLSKDFSFFVNPKANIIFK
ncbi:hypothetical protein M9Y10_031526 [Tritrichomonas musculus]|uniref:Surface antigen BspA-like n=1 Tax=Tritrichomonas musculus TaxID=1915356 RepID=A0ABR2GJF3_9EUKA